MPITPHTNPGVFEDLVMLSPSTPTPLGDGKLTVVAQRTCHRAHQPDRGPPLRHTRQEDDVSTRLGQ